MNRRSFVLVSVLGLLLLNPGTVFGGDKPAKPAPSANSQRTKSIKFEDDLVEGMNKNPLDSLERLGRRDGAAQGHLYHKPSEFTDALRQTVHEMGKTP